MSIDPDHYAPLISPNQLLMIHSDNDSTINLTDAQLTFSKANEPKKFSQVQGCPHGYCDKMYEDLKADLELLFGK